ncbi:MBL fold metallo-hydrolase [Mesobaculum littorinae]|uniref:MBL fold metallo-hydrolase n=1 Tax=Mesobaculum littorinae TaxID=2486419 RepID=A0A438AGM3_9RHOB|nr:MBL fold metallo-hydrolase [Mesobaculum littorinae]RVV97838.1 MBL fold metallo-hydrolase [Mesobaculum littorinae]
MDASPRQIRYPVDTPPAPGAATEIAPGVLWLRIPLPWALDHVNVYALDDGDAWTILDTGLDTPEIREVWETALAGPLAGKPVARVVLSHNHPDHVGLAAWFAAGGAEIVTTRTAYLLTRMLQLDVQDRPLPETLAFWRAAGMADEVYAERAAARPMNFADITGTLPLGYTRIVEGGCIRMGGRDWDIRMGNGHAPEHATFWSRDDDLVLGGDQLLPSISPNIGAHATEPLADPVAGWLESCERFATLATETQLVLPGHKLPYRGLPTRLDQLIENHHAALARLERHLDTPKTACDCFVPLFKREIRGDAYGLAMVEAMAHCVHLWHSGRATREITETGAWLWRRA